MFLSCSSKLHLQPLHNVLWFKITVQSKLNAKIWFNTSYCSCLLYIHTHWHNVLLRLIIYILNSGPVWNTEKHTGSQCTERHEKREWKTEKCLRKRQKLRRSCTYIVYPQCPCCVVKEKKKQAKSSAHTSPVAGKKHLHVIISANRQLKSIYTYCILYI